MKFPESSLAALRGSLASHFGVAVADLHLDHIPDGLSHAGFACRTGDQRFFIKVYAPYPGLERFIGRTNAVMKHMRRHGVPAPRTLPSPPGMANVAVHEFVRGSHYRADLPQALAAGRVYGRMARVGLARPGAVSTADWWRELKPVFASVREPSNNGVTVDPDLQRSWRDIAARTQALLPELAPAGPLTRCPLHCDWTEKNLLLRDGEVVLLCDWDKYQEKVLAEQLAGAAARTCAPFPHAVEIDGELLSAFLGGVGAEVLEQAFHGGRDEAWFSVLAVLSHLRSYPYRSRIVFHWGRTELKADLLDWPLAQSRWLLKRAASSIKASSKA